MRNFLLLFIFFSCLTFSCQNNIDKQKEIEKSDFIEHDVFREHVLNLRNAGLLKSISDKDLDSLIDVYRKDTLNGLKNMLVKSGELMQLDLNLNGKSPIDVYQNLCRMIGEKFPDLKNDSLNLKYLPNNPGGKDTGWVMMRQRIGKEVYVQKLYFIKEWPMDETFCKIYNQRLAAENKDYRVFLATFMCTDCINPMDDSKVKQNLNTMGIICLRKSQSDSVKSIEELALDPVDEFKVFSPKELEIKIKQFESTGILLKNDSAWWRVRKQQMRENSVYGFEDVCSYLDTLICTANFDTVNDLDPYSEILNRMEKISRGNFNLGAISDETQNSTTRTVRYTLKGKVYENDYEEKGGILFPGIVDDVNAALAEQKIDGAFYTVLSRDNVLLLVYLDAKTAEKAKASGFFTQFEKGAGADLKARYEGAPSS